MIRSVSDTEHRAWVITIHEGTTKENAARLQVWLGEYDLGHRQPAHAVERFRIAAATAPKSSSYRGLALFDEGLGLYLNGQYRESGSCLYSLLQSRSRGYPRKTAQAYLRHAGSCAGYHLRHNELGIPEPPSLDPLCAVAGMAVCLRELHIPCERSKLESIVRHDGEGSNTNDIITACAKLGLEGKVVLAEKARDIRHLPLPAIAHVEHDHFVAVTKASTSGVTYWCSDCGPFPGGAVHLTWQQWQAMDADEFIAVVRPGSAASIALLNLPQRPTSNMPRIRLAARGFASATLSSASRLLNSMHGLYQVAPSPGHYGLPISAPTCGMRGQSAFCVPFTHCPCVCSRTPGDPVNMATGAEEYKPAPDLVVYNPIGPSVTWQRAYYSTSNPPPTGFGAGWSHSYNYRLYETVQTFQDIDQTVSTFSFSLQFPNGSVSTASYRTTGLGPTAGNSITLPEPAGSPFQVIWACSTQTYSPQSASITVKFRDLTQIVFTRLSVDSSYTYQLWYPTKIVDAANNFITLDWTGAVVVNTFDPITWDNAAPQLADIRDSTGREIFVVGYSPSQMNTSAYVITSVCELPPAVGATRRGVEYNIKSYQNENLPPVETGQVISDEIIKASSPVTVTLGTASSVTFGSPSAWFNYDYDFYTNGEFYTNHLSWESVPYLTKIQLPNPSYTINSGRQWDGQTFSTTHIAYDVVSGAVTSITDAEGNTLTVTPQVTGPPGGYVVTSASAQLTDASNNLISSEVFTWTSNMSIQSKSVVAVPPGQQGPQTTYYTENYGYAGIDPYVPTTVTDGNNRSWSVTSDNYGNPLSVTTPKGIQTDYTWDHGNWGVGQLTQVQQSNGAQTLTPVNYTYNWANGNGLISTITTAIPVNQQGTVGTQTTSFVYTGSTLGQPTSILSPGHTTTFNYTPDGSYSQPEALGQPLSVTDDLGNKAHFRYDQRGNAIQSTNAAGYSTSYAYDLSNQVIDATLPPTGNTGPGACTLAIFYLYDGGPALAEGLYDESIGPIPLAIATPARTTTLSLGPEREVLSVYENGTQRASFTYDGAYRPTWAWHALPNAYPTHYTYDPAGRVSQVQYANEASYTKAGQQFTGNGLSQQYTWDTANNLTQYTDSVHGTISYAHDDLDGLLTSVSSAATGTNYQYGYDAFNRLSSLSDASASNQTVTTSYSYDDLGDLETKTDTFHDFSTPYALNYYYNPDQTRHAISVPVVGTFMYGYYANGWLQSIASGSTATFYQYWPDGRIKQRTLPNGAYSQFTYNPIRALTQVVNYAQPGSNYYNHTSSTYSSYSPPTGSSQFDSTFNMLGYVANVPSVPSQSGATAWSYDTRDRLTGERGPGTLGQQFTYGYDDAGNATTMRGVSASYNLLLNQNNASNYAYNESGDPTSYAGNSLVFDLFDRMTSFAVGGVAQQTASYRPDGLRCWKAGAGGSGKTYYVYDGDEPVLELNSSGTLTAINGFGPDGAIWRQEPSGQLMSYLPDLQGDVAQRLDSSGNVNCSFVYDAYGYAHSYGSSQNDPFAYRATAGYLYDSETGLYTCDFRQYDASTGRWVTRDPIGQAGGLNLYAYCGGNPVSYADPTGLASEEEIEEYLVEKAQGVLKMPPQGVPPEQLGAGSPPGPFEAPPPGSEAAGMLEQALGSPTCTSLGEEQHAQVTELLTGFARTASERAVLTDRQQQVVNAGLQRVEVFFGERVDWGVRKLAMGEQFLEDFGLEITPRFKFGPDFYQPRTGRWWDVTTNTSWAAHEARYDPVYGKGMGTLIPYPPQP